MMDVGSHVRLQLFFSHARLVSRLWSHTAHPLVAISEISVGLMKEGSMHARCGTLWRTAKTRNAPPTHTSLKKPTQCRQQGGGRLARGPLGAQREHRRLVKTQVRTGRQTHLPSLQSTDNTMSCTSQSSLRPLSADESRLPYCPPSPGRPRTIAVADVSCRGLQTCRGCKHCKPTTWCHSFPANRRAFTHSAP